jgi:hypothetical protein
MQKKNLYYFYILIILTIQYCFSIEEYKNSNNNIVILFRAPFGNYYNNIGPAIHSQSENCNNKPEDHIYEESMYNIFVGGRIIRNIKVILNSMNDNLAAYQGVNVVCDNNYSFNVGYNDESGFVAGGAVNIFSTKNIQQYSSTGNIFNLTGYARILNDICEGNTSSVIDSNNINNIGFITSPAQLIFPLSSFPATHNIILATKNYTVPGDLHNSIILATDNFILNTNNFTLQDLSTPTGGISVSAVCIDSNGKFYKASSALPIPSASKYKQNIHPIDREESKKIYDLDIVQYEYKQSPEINEYGIIADELKKKNIFKNSLRYDNQGNIDSVVYHNIMMAAIHELKELRKEFDLLKTDYSILKEKYLLYSTN